MTRRAESSILATICDTLDLVRSLAQRLPKSPARQHAKLERAIVVAQVRAKKLALEDKHAARRKPPPQR